MNLESRIKKIEQKLGVNELEKNKDEGMTLRVTGNTTEETIQNALNAIRGAKEKGQKWHWVNIDCPKEVDISAVVRAIIEELVPE
jgi:hypothetical protein